MSLVSQTFSMHSLTKNASKCCANCLCNTLMRPLRSATKAVNSPCVSDPASQIQRKVAASSTSRVATVEWAFAKLACVTPSATAGKLMCIPANPAFLWTLDVFISGSPGRKGSPGLKLPFEPERGLRAQTNPKENRFAGNEKNPRSTAAQRGKHT